MAGGEVTPRNKYSAWSMGTREAGSSVLEVTFSFLGFNKDMVFSRTIYFLSATVLPQTDLEEQQ